MSVLELAALPKIRSFATVHFVVSVRNISFRVKSWRTSFWGEGNAYTNSLICCVPNVLNAEQNLLPKVLHTIVTSTTAAVFRKTSRESRVIKISEGICKFCPVSRKKKSIGKNCD